MLIATAFGAALKKLRRARALSQKQLALDCGLDRTYISLLERGRRQPSLGTIFQLSKALNIPVVDMIRHTEKAMKRPGRRTLPLRR
jgi:transcriptional regulator with XRE-family HTH domain